MTNNDPALQLPQARAVLEYWLQDALELGWPSSNMSALWFGGGPALDHEIDDQFGHLAREAMAGGLADWEGRPLDRLALVILLDQFSRNIYRGQSQAFAGDIRAQALVMGALALSWDVLLPLAGRVFFYMPLMHAENIALQDECVRRFTSLVAGTGSSFAQRLQGHLEFAEKHRLVISEFGRFPHRNRVLERESTRKELEFLENGPRFGQ